MNLTSVTSLVVALKVVTLTLGAFLAGIADQVLGVNRTAVITYSVYVE
ncbi:hypothetical protein [Halorussus caseinilyticus]|uniref:Uncharacterized protein n=1 Tax=Halorussus caseinilyticus TaxID=3034025 RepID=A0ABD5WEG4_9EURY|nr:hypothetical protein [Halorussus sp. DT72]